jgi:hypothetical protein
VIEQVLWDADGTGQFWKPEQEHIKCRATMEIPAGHFFKAILAGKRIQPILLRLFEDSILEGGTSLCPVRRVGKEVIYDRIQFGIAGIFLSSSPLIFQPPTRWVARVSPQAMAGDQPNRYLL